MLCGAVPDGESAERPFRTGAAAGTQRHHVGKAGLAQREVPVVADRVGAVGHHRPAGKARLLAPGRERRRDLRFRAEGRVGPAAGEVMGGGVRLRVQRVVDPPVGPHRGHRDDPVVGLAQSAQPLPAHVRGRGAVLAVPGVVDDQHTLIMRGGGRIGANHLKPPVIDLPGVPGGLRQEELQPLHGRILRAGHRLGAGQAGQRLVPVPRRQQGREVLAQATSLGERDQQVVKAGRVLLQRTRRGDRDGGRSSSAPRRAIDSYHRPTANLPRRQPALPLGLTDYR